MSELSHVYSDNEVNQFGYIDPNKQWPIWWRFLDLRTQGKHIRFMRVFGCYGDLPLFLGHINLGQVFALLKRVKRCFLIGDRFSIEFHNALQLSVMGTRPITTIFSGDDDRRWSIGGLRRWLSSTQFLPHEWRSIAKVVALLPKYILRFFDRGSARSFSRRRNLELCGVRWKFSLRYLSDHAFVIIIIASRSVLKRRQTHQRLSWWHSSSNLCIGTCSPRLSEIEGY